MNEVPFTIFSFFTLNIAYARHHWNVEITRYHLQSLIQVLFGAFYSFPDVTRDCDLHTQGDPLGILSGIDEMVDADAMIFDLQGSFCDSLDRFCTAPSSWHSFSPVGIYWPNNTSASSLGKDCIEKCLHNVGR